MKKNITFINLDEKYIDKNSAYSAIELKFLTKLGKSTPNMYKALAQYKGFNKDTVIVEFIGAKENNIKKEQYNAYNDFLNKENIFYEKIIKNIFEYYKLVYAEAINDPFFKGLENSLKKPRKENDIFDLVKLNSIHIHQPQENKVSKVGFSFWCEWDEEHGLGILFERDNVIDIGLEEVIYPDE